MGREEKELIRLAKNNLQALEENVAYWKTIKEKLLRVMEPGDGSQTVFEKQMRRDLFRKGQSDLSESDLSVKSGQSVQSGQSAQSDLSAESGQSVGPGLGVEAASSEELSLGVGKGPESGAFNESGGTSGTESGIHGGAKGESLPGDFSNEGAELEEFFSLLAKARKALPVWEKSQSLLGKYGKEVQGAIRDVSPLTKTVLQYLVFGKKKERARRGKELLSSFLEAEEVKRAAGEREILLELDSAPKTAYQEYSLSELREVFARAVSEGEEGRGFLEDTGSLEKTESLDEKRLEGKEGLEEKDSSGEEIVLEKKEYLPELKSLLKVTEKATQRLHLAKREKESAIDSVKVSVEKVSLEQCQEVLEGIPVEELNRDKIGIRTKALREMGIETLKDVYEASQEELSKVKGISREMAGRVKEIGAEMALKVARSSKIRISADNRTEGMISLIRSLYSYRRLDPGLKDFLRLEEIYGAGTEKEVRVLWEKGNYFEWVFYPEEEKEQVIRAFTALNEKEEKVEAFGEGRSIDLIEKQGNLIEGNLTEGNLTEGNLIEENLIEDGTNLIKEQERDNREKEGDEREKENSRVEKERGEEEKENNGEEQGDVLSRRVPMLSDFRSDPIEVVWEDFSGKVISYIQTLEALVPGALGNDDSLYGLPQELSRDVGERQLHLDGLKVSLRRYQEWGVKYALSQERTILGDEMGLGKTIQAIASIVSLRADGGTHFMVICPASVLVNWCKEIKEKSDLKLISIYGSDRLQAFQRFLKEGGVAVTTYETTEFLKFPQGGESQGEEFQGEESQGGESQGGESQRGESQRGEPQGGKDSFKGFERTLQKVKESLDDGEGAAVGGEGNLQEEEALKGREESGHTAKPIDLLVVDEAHYIKNEFSRRSRNVRRICGQARKILFLTGTAIENRVEEMISLMEVLRPTIASQAKQIAFMSSAQQFRDMVSGVYYRRKREEVLTELPELIETKEWCVLGFKERLEYEKAVLSEHFSEARRVSFQLGSLEESSKAQRLMKIVEEAREDGRKVLVFSFFLETLRLVRSYLGERAMETIKGSVSPERRQEIIEEFEKAPVGTVLPAQIVSGGTGLNIQAASVVILCEPQLKPSIENQAISRAYRMGQSRNVLVYRLLAQDTVDERITQLLEEKQAVFDAFADRSAAAEGDLDGMKENTEEKKGEGKEEEKEISIAGLGKIMSEESSRIRKERGSGEKKESSDLSGLQEEEKEELKGERETEGKREELEGEPIGDTEKGLGGEKGRGLGGEHVEGEDEKQEELTEELCEEVSEKEGKGIEEPGGYK